MKPLDAAATLARILANTDADYPAREEHARHIFMLVHSSRRRHRRLLKRRRRLVHRLQEPV